MALPSATEQQFTDFLSLYGYTVSESQPALLARALAFINSLPFCEGAETNEQIVAAQCFVAYSMSRAGGRFNPLAVTDNRTVTKRKVDTLEIEYEGNAELSGVDSMSLLARMPVVYGLLKSYLCPAGNGAIGVSVFVV